VQRLNEMERSEKVFPGFTPRNGEDLSNQVGKNKSKGIIRQKKAGTFEEDYLQRRGR